jgi:hypothetical protein
MEAIDRLYAETKNQPQLIQHTSLTENLEVFLVQILCYFL